jgi:siroheme synthase-like protein
MNGNNPFPRFLPVSVRIEGKELLVVGGGQVALHKAVILAGFTERVTVVAPDFVAGFEELPFRRHRKAFEACDLEGIFLTYICTGERVLNASIQAECARQGVLASVCDDVELCDFISPAIYREGYMTVAVSSDGRDVRHSIRLRDRLKEYLRLTSNT